MARRLWLMWWRFLPVYTSRSPSLIVYCIQPAVCSTIHRHHFLHILVVIHRTNPSILLLLAIYWCINPAVCIGNGLLCHNSPRSWWTYMYVLTLVDLYPPIDFWNHPLRICSPSVFSKLGVFEVSVLLATSETNVLPIVEKTAHSNEVGECAPIIPNSHSLFSSPFVKGSAKCFLAPTPSVCSCL